MIGELLHHADQDVERAQRGIVFIDEIDKIARRSQGARTGAGSRDIGGEGVQQGLLKLLEGREIFAPLNVTQHWNKHDFVVVDTQDILFIAAGTFSDLHLTEASEAGRLRRRRGDGDARAGRRVTEKELLDYGFLAEFLGRLPVRVELASLSEDDLLPDHDRPARRGGARVPGAAQDGRRRPALLRARRCAPSPQYCIRRRTGARSLRTLVEEICHDIMFEAPERKGETVTSSADMVAAAPRRARAAARAATMKISELFAARRPPPVLVRVLPPKTDAGAQTLERTIRELRRLAPAFVSVTYGAGGSTRAQTVELVQSDRARGRHRGDGAPDLRRAPAARRSARCSSGWSSAGIENIMALRGDPPGGPGEFQRGAGRLRLRLGADRLHPPALRHRLLPGRRRLPRGARRVPRPRPRHRAPARPRWTPALDFVVTQLFFDNRVYFDFVERARAAGITVPIVPGIMPIRNVGADRAHDQAVRRDASRRRCSPSWSAAATTTPAVAALGVAQATAQCVELLHGGAPGHPLLHAEPVARRRA